MKRREFLKSGALALVGTAASASRVIAAANAGSAPRLTTLNGQQGQTLLKVVRRIFPHNKLDDTPYWNVVRDLDKDASSDQSTRKILAEGLESLDLKGRRFVDLSEKEQTAVLRRIETTAFFQKVRSAELQGLYSDPEVWKAFGYEGPAYRFGGYVHRGFDDLAWLPNPPESASPKPA